MTALQKPRKGARYTPVSKRLEKPDAIFWLVRNHPELPDAVIGRLVGTTKATIDKVRNRTHWNATNLKASDPVTLGLCTQIELDEAIEKANRDKSRAAKGTRRNTLRPAKETVAETEELLDAVETDAEETEGGPEVDAAEDDEA